MQLVIRLLPINRLLFVKIISAMVIALLSMIAFDRIASAAPPEPLTFNQVKKYQEDGIIRLGDVRSLAISPDGDHVYAVGYGSHSITSFSRNSSTGKLTYVTTHLGVAGDAVSKGIDGIEGLTYPTWITVSPDGNHVYVACHCEASVFTFSRNSSTGALALVEMLQKEIDLFSGDLKADSVTVSPDGKHVYVASKNNNAIFVFNRNSLTGKLTHLEIQKNGIGDVNGLRGVNLVTLSPEGKHLYATGKNNDAIVVFSRDTSSGSLNFVEFHQQSYVADVDGIWSLNTPSVIAVSLDGKFLFVGSQSGLSVWDRDLLTGSLTKGYRNGGCIDAITLHPDGEHIYVACKDGNSVQTRWFNKIGGKNSLDMISKFQAGSLHPDGYLPFGTDIIKDTLEGPSSVVISPDGKHLYVAGSESNTVVVFTVNPSYDNLYVDFSEYLELSVVGKENPGYSPVFFPSGSGIEAQFEVVNPSKVHQFIPSGARVMTFSQGYFGKSIDVVSQKSTVIKGKSKEVFKARFDSNVLNLGLNQLVFTFDPDGAIGISNGGKTLAYDGRLKLFHPSAYPDIRITEVLTPEYVQVFTPPELGRYNEPFEVTVKVKNFGADMTRPSTIQSVIHEENKSFYGKMRVLDLLEAGQESIKKFEYSNKSIRIQDSPYIVEIRIQDGIADMWHSDWEEIMNGGYPWILEADIDVWNVDSPMELGSEDQVMGPSQGSCLLGGAYCAPTPADYNGNNIATGSFNAINPIPYPIYPRDGQALRVGEYPPLIANEYSGKWDVGTELCGFVSSEIGNEPVLNCFGIVTQEFIDKYPAGLKRLEWLEGWPNSLLRFRWLPWGSKNCFWEAKFQIKDEMGDLIHETLLDPHLSPVTEGVFTGCGKDELWYLGKDGRSYNEIYDFWFNNSVQPLLDNSALQNYVDEGYFFQYVYDGPVLFPGDYTWRVTYDPDAHDDSVTWSEWSNFVIEAHDLLAGDSTRLRDNNLSDQMLFHGKVMNLRPEWVSLVYPEGWISVRTESGLVHLQLDSETTFSTPRPVTTQTVLIGREVEVTSSEVPYISGSSYVPEASMPIVEHIRELVKPSTIYPEDGRVFQLGDLPPVADNWANCSSVGCDPESLQSQPILEDWKVDWVDSLLRFRWLRIATEDGMDPASRMQVYDDAGALAHEAILTPGSVDPVHSGITVDETQELGGDGRHYNEIYDHGLSDMRLLPGEAKDTAGQGKFYQYAYDGPVLLPGDYTWRVTYDVDADDALAVWSDESSFSVVSDHSGAGDSIVLEDTHDYDNSTAMTFRGKVTAVRPGGFSVIHREGTDTNLVNMRTDSSSIIFSPMYGLQTEVVKDSTVFVLSERVPYISGRAYVPREQVPLALEVTEHLMLSKHKRCTALSEVADGKVAFSCADGDYVELAASDMPFDDEIVAGSSAVILVKHTTATEDCTVIANIPGDKSVVECPDGDRVQVDGTHEVNKTLPMPVDAESFKLVSTATSLINRLQRFDLVEHQGQVTSGFTEAFEQAVANASPEVKQFMELMDDLDDKVINFAESFKTGSGQMLFDPRNIEALADQIQEFADSYGRIIGFIVVEALFELAKEKQDEIIKLIDFQSTQFISGMKNDLEKVVKLLRQANLQGAISALDEATAREQEWEEQVVMPKIIGALALDSIETAQKELNEYGDSLPQNVREDLTDRLNALKQEWAKSGPETQRLMDELWAAMAAAFSSDNTDGEQGIGQDIAGKAKEMILIAESDLDQYGKFMSSAVKSGIEKAVSDLRELIEPNIDPDGKDEVQDAIDILASALNWSDESGDQDTEARANEIIAMAESELEQYGKYMTAETKEKINKLLVDLKEISKPPIDPASSSKVQTVIDELAVALTEAASLDSESSGSDEQGPDLTEAAKEALGVASDIIGTYSDSMDPGIISAIKEHSTALQAALDNGEDMSASFEALTSILKELKDQAPKPQDGFNITIECAPQIKVGREMVCSFKNDRNPDSVTWTAAGGTPASGNGSTFQTSFAAEGTYLISLKACVGSNCIEDVQQINVVAGSSGQQGSGQSSGGETKFSVSIECASQMEVGQQIGCSFRYNRTPNTIEWSADGGTPASGSDSSFQTTFGTVGQYSISLKACMGSECITDVQAIEVVASKQSSEGK